MPSRSDSYPPTGAVLVDLSGGNQVFSPPLRGVSIGGAGNLRVDLIDNNNVVIPAACLAVGIQHGMVIKQIYQSGTTATFIIGWR